MTVAMQFLLVVGVVYAGCAVASYRKWRKRPCGDQRWPGVKWSHDYVRCSLMHHHDGPHRDTRFGYWWDDDDWCLHGMPKP